ncbi:hypothetical protein VTJ04DRAFT_656 [Mycothermus thermophilus]|uniref:uncharacterized protein n=1 Tax=Humicola insolens TaxID=85995 RepID=UPI0037437B45
MMMPHGPNTTPGGYNEMRHDNEHDLRKKERDNDVTILRMPMTMAGWGQGAEHGQDHATGFNWDHKAGRNKVFT